MLVRRSLKVSLVGQTIVTKAVVRLGYSFSEIAERTYLSKSTVQRFFSGRPVLADTFYSICQLLNLNPEEIIDKPKEEKENNDVLRDNLVKAVTCDIPLGKSALDAYMLPSGEKRLGVENVGIALGYSKRFFFQRTSRDSKTLKVLKDMGFSGEQIWVDIIRHGDKDKDSWRAKTISLRDFIKLVTYEAVVKRKLEGIILLAAIAEVGIERILDDAFSGKSVDFLLEKIVHYTEWTYEELEEVLTYNREEVKALYPWGLPPSLDSRR